MDDVLATIAAHWDERAATFDDEPDHGLAAPATRAAWRRRLTGWLPSPPARVVDLGCGTGSLAVLLASEGYEVTASDIAPAMVERARRKAADAGVPIEFMVADAARPASPAGSVDVVLIRHLAWTLPAPLTAIDRWARSLRPEGRLVMVEGRWGTPTSDVAATSDGAVTSDGASRTAGAASSDGAPSSDRASRSAGAASVDEPPGRGGHVAAHLPWYGGVDARTLTAVLRARFEEVHLDDLGDDPDLWGGAVTDERFAVVARGPRPADDASS